MGFSASAPGLDSIKALFALYPDHQRMSFFAQDGRLIDDFTPHKPEKLRVAILDRQGENRILTRRQTGLVIRPNGMIPCCIYGRQRRDFVVKWDERLCFRWDSLFGIDGLPGKAWAPYHGPYSRQADRLDWFKKTLLWTPKREEAVKGTAKKRDDWDAYEDIRQSRGRSSLLT